MRLKSGIGVVSDIANGLYAIAVFRYMSREKNINNVIINPPFLNLEQDFADLLVIIFPVFS